MNRLIFASHNQGKTREMQALLGGSYEILSLSDLGIHNQIAEPHNTLAENALEKARAVQSLTGSDCFSEDSGLEVDALQGAPGVRSARFAGANANAEDNIRLLLQRMEGFEDRSARFRTVICLLVGGQPYFFEGVCSGQITHSCMGTEGFGYDPVFIPDGSHLSFGQMSMTEKNQFSHRKKAVLQMVAFLTGN